MNDEDAFLKAIMADRYDPALKLIYADWLEERGDRRSEFLRLEVQLTRISEQDEQYQNIRKKLESFYPLVDPVWRQQISFPYDAILESYSPEYTINVVKQVRVATGMGLAEALIIIQDAQDAPAPIKERVSREEAQTIKETIEVDLGRGKQALIRLQLSGRR